MPVNDCLTSQLQSHVMSIDCTAVLCVYTWCWFVGDDDLTGALHISSCSCHHHLSHSNKMQNGDILVPADPGLPGKMTDETGRESIWLCGPPWV